MKSKWAFCLNVILLLMLTHITYAQDQTNFNWPKVFTANGNQMVVYQPEVDTWKDQLVLSGKAAVQLTLSGQTQPLTGAIWFTADTTLNQQNRMVLIDHLNIEKVTFFDKNPTLVKQATVVAKNILPAKSISISLDQLLANIEKSQTTQNVLLNNKPPSIFVSESPARLVVLNGEPLWKAITSLPLTFAVNTNWDLFFEPNSKTYFLRDDDHWLSSTDFKNWNPVQSLPTVFNQLPSDDNWVDVKKALPPKVYGSQEVPKIFISTVPSELIVIKGKPQLRAIAGTSLAAVENTESDLFFDNVDHNYYYLVAGRWFKASSLQGPWTFTSDHLPSDFAKIPESDPRANVLVSVPGTRAAKNAVIEASIPQLATVKRNELTLTVQYSGEPTFKSIPGTSLQYAVNTSTIVIKAGNTYYALANGVWFTAENPKGPWTVAITVPNEIYQIPPSSPVYNATYVKIYSVNSAQDEVEFGYTAGYLDTFVADGLLVFGTGYYYPPYLINTVPYQPIYYPYSNTYGMGAYYSPYYGGYYRNDYNYGPYGGINGYSVYNPNTGAYMRAGYAYGPYQSTRGFVAYNPSTGASAKGYQSTTPYASWGHAVASKGNEWANAGYYSGSNVKMAGSETSAGNAAAAVKPTGGDLYVGRDGNVYRNDNGSWEKYENNSWTPVNTHQNTMQQTAPSQSNQPSRSARPSQSTPINPEHYQDLNRQYEARQWGQQHAQRFQRWQAAGGGNPRGFGGGERFINRSGRYR